MGTALITGATVGIGREFARLLAGEGFDLVLVARTEADLSATAAELEQRFGVAVETLTADLTEAAGLRRVEKRIASTQRPIDLLVNNAGFGLPTRFGDNAVELEAAQFDLLARVPMRLTHAAVSTMIPRGGGSIINVSSVAGWIPRTTYGAAKAYTTAFTRAVDHDCRAKGIRIMALCPGYTRTEFHDRGGISIAGIPRFMWLDAPAVVAAAWRDFARGRTVSVPNPIYKIARGLLRFVG